jgi:hypothetical protein
LRELSLDQLTYGAVSTEKALSLHMNILQPRFITFNGDFYGEGHRLSNNLSDSLVAAKILLKEVEIGVKADDLRDDGVVSDGTFLDWSFLESLDPLIDLNQSLFKDNAINESPFKLRKTKGVRFCCGNSHLVKTQTPLLDYKIADSKLFLTNENRGGILTSTGDSPFFFFDECYMESPNKALRNEWGILSSSSEPYLKEQGGGGSVHASESESIDRIIYLSHPWSWNYQIYLFETVFSAIPLISLQDQGYSFMVRPDHFRIEALRMIGIREENIISINRPEIKLLNTIVPTRKFNLEYLGSDFVDYIQAIRDRIASLSKEQSLAPRISSCVYLGRRKDPEKSSGKNRFILNESEFETLLDRYSARRVFAEDYVSISEKVNSLRGSSVVITTIGANLVNVLLSGGISTIIVIASPLWGHARHYWRNLFALVHPAVNYIEYLQCFPEIDGSSQDPINYPYLIDLDGLESILQAECRQ